MRFTLFTLGSRGDAQPYAALGRALLALGQDVTVCAPETFRGLFQGLGLDFAPVPWDPRADAADEGLRRSLTRGGDLGFFRHLAGKLLEQKDGILEAWIRAARSGDALVAGSLCEEHVPLLGQALGKPVILSELLPFTPSSGYASIALKGLGLGPLNGLTHTLERALWWRLQRPLASALAQALGLEAPRRSPALEALGSGTPVLHGYSPALFPRPADWGEARHWLDGAWRLEGSDAQALPGDHHDAGFAVWLEDGPPPVYLGFGSLPVLDGTDLVELAGDLAETLDLRVVLGAGWTPVEGPDCDLPEGVAVSAECDHAWLFERCCAVIHHGGAGTTHAACAAGLPQVVCPVFADQPFWAGQVRKSGAGRVLPFRRMDAGGLARALSEALSGACPDAAVELAERMRGDAGAPGAARRLLEWAGTGQTVSPSGGADAAGRSC